MNHRDVPIRLKQIAVHFVFANQSELALMREEVQRTIEIGGTLMVTQKIGARDQERVGKISKFTLALTPEENGKPAIYLRPMFDPTRDFDGRPLTDSTTLTKPPTQAIVVDRVAIDTTLSADGVVLLRQAQ